MRRRPKYTIFNNFNKKFHEGSKDPNYFDEYVNEFSEELFDQTPSGMVNDLNPNKLYYNDLDSYTNWSSLPRNGEDFYE